VLDPGATCCFDPLTTGTRQGTSSDGEGRGPVEIDEVKRLVREESGDLADLAEGLTPQEWDADSTCAGWRVKHVVSHMATGATYPLGRLLAAVVRARGNRAQAAHRMAIEFGDTHSQRDVVATFRRGHEGEPLTFFARSLDPREVLVDHLVHHQDIRRSLDRPRVVPPHRLAAAFDLLPEVGGATNTRALVQGLRFHAADLDRSIGAGPVVEGPAEALVMAAAGRREVLPELRGEGAAALASRLN
jgi:uncharacterized protein (TIGR03083 family)